MHKEGTNPNGTCMHAMVLLLLVKIGAVRKWLSTVRSQKEVGRNQLMMIKDVAVSGTIVSYGHI
jgi:hypothetical protein